MEQRRNIYRAKAGRLGLFFVKVALGFLLKLVSVQRLELRKQLAVAAHQALRAYQVFVSSEGTAEINPVRFPVIANLHVSKVGIGVVNQFVKDPDFVHLVVPGVWVGHLYFAFEAILLVHLHR